MMANTCFDLALSLLRQEVAAADLLPKPYTRYRPLLADGLCFFLQRLSPVRARRIFVEQSQLPSSATTAERVVALLQHSPVLHKLGQAVARDHRLDIGFRKRLQQLESLGPRTPAARIVRRLERERKGWRTAGIELGPEAASLVREFSSY